MGIISIKLKNWAEYWHKHLTGTAEKPIFSPFVLKDKDNVKLTLALTSDPHLQLTEPKPWGYDCLFENVKKSELNVDALLICGDLTNLGVKGEYDRLFGSLKNQFVIPKVLVTMGNHDARFFFERNRKRIIEFSDLFLGLKTGKKSYYSYDINGYTIVMLCTEKRIFEKAYISSEQLSFLNAELDRANGKPVFVVCHQPLQNMHGLPEIWKTGDIGMQSDEIKEILSNHKNVFYLNGHIHSGVRKENIEAICEKNNVWSITVPCFGKINDRGDCKDAGLGLMCEVYDNEVIFSGWNFKTGAAVEFSRSIGTI